MTKKNIAIAWESITDGGVNSYLRYLLTSKKFKNFNIYIITNSTNEGAKYLKKDLRNMKNIKFVMFKSFFVKKKNLIKKIIYYFLKPIFFIKTIEIFDKIFKKIHIDILICQCGNYGNFRSEQAAIFSAHKKKIRKIFLVVHHKCEKYPFFYKQILKFINSKIREKINFLITVSRATMQSIKTNSNLLTARTKTKIIHNGVKIEKFKKKNYLIKIFKKYKIRSSHLKIGILSRIDTHKGHDILIKSISCLKNDIRQKLRVLIIGRGSTKDINNLKLKIKKLKLEKNFIILNYLNINSQKILSSLDLLVSPTKDFEGFGLSIAESIIVGTPIIASKVGGVPEFFKSQYGRLIKPKNYTELKKAIENFYFNKKKWVYNINKSQKNFRKYYNNEEMAKNYISLIN